MVVQVGRSFTRRPPAMVTLPFGHTAAIRYPRGIVAVTAA